MSTALELAPPIEVVETVDGDLDIPDMVAHLYAKDAGLGVALCGISNKNDPHNRMHRAEEVRAGEWKRGLLACPTCGAPACDKCLAIALTLR